MHTTIMLSPQQSYQADAQEKQSSHSLKEREVPDGDAAQWRAQGGARPLNIGGRQILKKINCYLPDKQAHQPERWKTYRSHQSDSTSYDDQEDHCHEAYYCYEQDKPSHPQEASGDLSSALSRSPGERVPNLKLCAPSLDHP